MLYETEEQQVEALKKWWKENGKSIVAGVVIGLAAVMGWRQWNEYRHQVAGQASNLFDQLLVSVERDEADTLAAQADLIRKDFGSTPYADFSWLMQAKVALDRGDTAAARGALEQALSHSPDPAFQTITVLRLARLHLDQDRPEVAGALLLQYPAPVPFAGEYAVLRGDIALARGDVAAARQAWQEAISAHAGNADLVQLKLENLPPVPTS